MAVLGGLSLGIETPALIVFFFFTLDSCPRVWYHARTDTGVSPRTCPLARPVGPSNERHTMTDPKTPKTPDQQAFEDAAAHMSQEDWDADNDWLASAGWGEM
jgi:hypothetical protein